MQSQEPHTHTPIYWGESRTSGFGIACSLSPATGGQVPRLLLAHIVQLFAWLPFIVIRLTSHSKRAISFYATRKKKHPLWITYRHLQDLCLLRSLDTFECRMLKKWTTCFNRRMLAFFPGCCQRMLIALKWFISLTHWNPDSQDIRVVS